MSEREGQSSSSGQRSCPLYAPRNGREVPHESCREVPERLLRGGTTLTSSSPRCWPDPAWSSRACARACGTPPCPSPPEKPTKGRVSAAAVEAEAEAEAEAELQHVSTCKCGEALRRSRKREVEVSRGAGRGDRPNVRTSLLASNCIISSSSPKSNFISRKPRRCDERGEKARV